MIRRAAKNPMTSVEVQSLAKQIKNTVSKDARLFRDFGGKSVKGLSGIKNYKLSGVPRLFGNKGIRSLMGRTKFWAAFLDWLGVANFVGPDQLINKMGPDKFKEKMNEYTKTSTAQQAWEDDFSGVQDETSGYEDQSTQAPQQPSKAERVVKDAFTDWIFGPLAPTVA